MRIASGALAILLTFALSAFTQTPPPHNWDSLDQQLEQAYLKGDLPEALRVAKLAAAAAVTPQQSGRSLDRLGYLYYVSGNLQEGEKLLRQALEIRREKVGPDTPDYAESLNDLALFCRDTRRLDEARKFAEEAVAVRTRVLDPKDPLLAETMETLGSIYDAHGEYELADSVFAKARAIYETQLDPKNPPAEYGTLLINIGGNDQRLGRYQKAESDFQTGLGVLSKNPGVQHPIYATSLTGPALLEMELGHYALSEKYYNQADELLKKELGEQHPIYIQVLDHRANLYQAMGNVAAAEADFTAALAARRKIYGPNHELVAATLRNYGRLVSLSDPKAGERLLQESVDIFSRSSDHPPFEFASALLSLAEAQRKLGDLSDAGKNLRQGLEVAEKGLGEKHPVYASLLENLAWVHEAAHEYPRAEERLRQAIAIVTETQGANHPDAGRFVHDLALLYDLEGKYRDAAPLYRRSFEINDAVLSDILDTGSEATKVAELANLDDPVPALIAFQGRAGDQLPEARALAFEAVARRKGRVLDEVRDWRERLRVSSDPAVVKRFNEWQDLVECQSSISIALGYRDLKPAVVGGCSLPETQLAGRYERLLADLRTKWSADLGKKAVAAIQVIQQRREALETALSREAPAFAGGFKPARFEDIRAHLRPDEIFVELVAYQPNGSGTRPAQRYGAFVIDAARNLHWVDLGPSAPVDQAVRDLSEAARDWSDALAGGERSPARAAEQTAQTALRQISKTVLTPLESFIASPQVHRIRIAPDGMLTLVPFGALTDRQDRFLIERFAIGYIPAGRDLVAPHSGAVALSAPVIAVSPGAAPTQAASITSLGSAFRAERLTRLEGATNEAHRLQTMVPTARLLAEGQATEQQVKQLRSPALLHVVGHGVVRRNEDCRSEPNTPGCAAPLDAASRVMSLSAIVLEEAYGRGGRSSQDGLLTASELENVDLQGTEMLVLSQCQMAGGVPSSGEGVYGMRRAAAIAGVRTFVAPLWNVADAPERMLMERFYKELAAGHDRAEALRQAQLQLFKTPATRSFLYWAPVILSGATEPLPRTIFQR